MNLLQIRRVYDLPEVTDGFRILIDRLWPRGLKKETAHIDFWCKDVAPSPELRIWFHHKPERYPLFRDIYFSELNKNSAAEHFVEICKTKLNGENVTLLYAAKDTTNNHAAILLEWIASKIGCDS